jgi:hypothetical protein
MQELHGQRALHKLYLEIWNKRPHYSQISRRWLGNEPLSVFFHHILPKRKYIEAIFDEQNIILVTKEEHENIERSPFMYPIVNRLRTKLLKKYGLK